jgi:hypothetical protein
LHAPQAFGALLGCVFLLGWFNKLLVAGFAVLGLKASGTVAHKESVQKLKKTARRMSLATGEMFAVAKAKAM